MAFPQVDAVNGGNNTEDSTEHTVNLPANISAGNLLLVFFASDEVPTITFPEGWTQLFQEVNATCIKFGAWYRIADGEEGATITVTTSASEQSAHTSYRITGYSGTPEAGTATTGYTVNPNPPNLTPSWGAADTLWFASCSNDFLPIVTVYPTDYTDGRYDNSYTINGCLVGTARRELNAVSEDPGTFTLSFQELWVANTVAIKPVGPVTHEGAATLVGIGTLAGISVITFIGKATLSGIGTLATIWERVKKTTATSQGVGTLASKGVRIRGVTATLSGVGTLASVGRLIAIGKSTLAGVGTLASIAHATFIGKSTLAGVGTLSVLGGLLRTASATLAGVGTLAAIGTTWVYKYGVATLAGVGTLAGIAHVTLIGKATLAGVGTLASIGVRLLVGKATLAGVGTLTTAWTRVRSGTATLSGLGTLASIGVITAIGKATVAGVGTLASISHVTFIGKATLAGVGTLASIGSFIRYGSATLSGVGSLSAIGHYIFAGAATLAGVGTLIVRAIRIRIRPKYILELRDSDGALISILQKSYHISYSQFINSAHELTFTIPADDSKVTDITLANEIWLRNHRTNTVIKKFKLGRKREVRE